MAALPYDRIAKILDEICRAPRAKKADIAAALLSEIPPECLCPAVRLMMSGLWPAWESRELGIGPQAVMKALEEISLDDIASLYEKLGDIGSVAESALQNKAQHPLTASALDAIIVYDTLRHISKMSGPKSDQRKIAALRGLMMDATPLEGKYIARTALGNIAAGFGPGSMIEAISEAFGFEHDYVHRAYSLMPDPGMLAISARERTLSEIKMQPFRPIKPMQIRTGTIKEAFSPLAALPVYPGLSVQVHLAAGRMCVYTARLRNISSSLFGLAGELPSLSLNHDMIFEARLMGFLDKKAICQSEVVRYINRKHFARRSRASPALMAYDILYLDGDDLMGLAYHERRKRLLGVLGQPKGLPFRGISSVNEKIFDGPQEIAGYLAIAQEGGCKCIVLRDLEAHYEPGRFSGNDILLKGDTTGCEATEVIAATPAAKASAAPAADQVDASTVAANITSEGLVSTDSCQKGSIDGNTEGL